MTTEEILKALRSLLAKHEGHERDLLEELIAEAEGWKMRLDEMESDTEGE